MKPSFGFHMPRLQFCHETCNGDTIKSMIGSTVESTYSLSFLRAPSWWNYLVSLTKETINFIVWWMNVGGHFRMQSDLLTIIYNNPFFLIIPQLISVENNSLIRKEIATGSPYLWPYNFMFCAEENFHFSELFFVKSPLFYFCYICFPQSCLKLQLMTMVILCIFF